MEWMKERVFEFSRECPNHIETKHWFHMRLRSDGAAFWQMEHRKNQVLMTERFNYFLTLKRKQMFDEAGFDESFERIMKEMGGVEAK